MHCRPSLCALQNVTVVRYVISFWVFMGWIARMDRDGKDRDGMDGAVLAALLCTPLHSFALDALLCTGCPPLHWMGLNASRKTVVDRP
eukprot:7503077-Pyramimonas_sp.AAC.2